MLFKEIEYKIHSTIRDELGRYILIDIEFLNRCMTLGNVYEPSSGDQPEFFEEVFNKITSFDNEPIVVGGDWNVAVNPTLDTNHPSSVNRNRSRGKIQELIECLNVNFLTLSVLSFRKRLHLFAMNLIYNQLIALLHLTLLFAVNLVALSQCRKSRFEN